MSLWYVWPRTCNYLAPTLNLSPNRLRHDSTWAPTPRSSIGCVQNDFWASGMFYANRAHILRQGYHYLQTYQNKLPHDPHHQAVPSSAFNTFSKPIVCLAQTVHLYCVKISTIYKRTETSFQLSIVPSTIGCIENNFRAYGMFSANRAPILQRHWHYFQMKQNKIRHDPRHLGVPSDASKPISEPMVCLAQTVQLVKISTISKRTKTSFHMSLVT
jgi:hypothetical protein